MFKTFPKRLWHVRWSIAGALLIAHLCFRFERRASSQGYDFRVFWNAALQWWNGVSPYLEPVAGLRGFIFKYPPWILPLFGGLGVLNYSIALTVWAWVQIAGILAMVLWLVRSGVSLPIALWTCWLYSVTWMEHAASGQVSIVMVALALWGYRMATPLGTALVALVLSVKLFSLTALAGIASRFRNPRTWFWLMGGAAALHVAVWLRYPHWLSLYPEFIRAANSGGTQLGEGVVRGTENHGLPATLLRALRVPATSGGWDILVSLACTALFGGLWWRASQRFVDGKEGPRAWVGWLALSAICHPLAWHHSYVFTFPLAAFALNDSWQITQRRKTYQPFGFAVVGLACITLLVPQIVSDPVFAKLHPLGIKNWGVLLLCLAMVRTSTDSTLGRVPPTR